MNLPIFILAALWGNLYLIHTSGLTNTKSSMVISMIFIGEIIGAPIIGWVSDMLQNRKIVMLAGAFLSLITTILLLYSSHFSITTLSLLFFLLGFFISTQVIGYSVIAESNDSSILSTASGFGSTIVNTLGALGQVLFPLLLTLHLTMSSENHLNGGYKTAFMMLPIAFLISIVVVFFMKETFNNAKVTAVDFQIADLGISQEKALSQSL